MRAELDRVLAALADPHRRAAVELLRSGPRSAGELAEALDLSRPSMSRHLRVLRQVGLVEQEVQEEDARVRMVHLRREPLADLRGWVEELESYWSDQLRSFRAHAERGRRRRRR